MISLSTLTEARGNCPFPCCLLPPFENEFSCELESNVNKFDCTKIDDLFTLRWLRTKEPGHPLASIVVSRLPSASMAQKMHEAKLLCHYTLVSTQASADCWLPTRLPCSPSRTSTSHHLCHRLRCLVSAHQCIHIKSFPPEFQQGYELPNLTDTHSNSSFRLVRGTESWCRRRTGQRYGNFKLHPSNSIGQCFFFGTLRN